MLTPGIKYMPKYSGNNYELRICRAKMEDKGEYIVRAENSYGSREEVAFLNVERKLITGTDIFTIHYICQVIKPCMLQTPSITM